MHYSVTKCDSATRYEYTFEDNTSCVFSVNKVGIIYIDSKEKVKTKYLREALREVSDNILERGLIPKINIQNSCKFYRDLAAMSGFKKLPSRGVSFSVWVRRWKWEIFISMKGVI